AEPAALGSCAVRPPPVERQVLDDANLLGRLVEQATTRRSDLQALSRRGLVAQLERVSAGDALKPQVDLVGNVGYIGLNEGSQVYRFLNPFGSSGSTASPSVVVDWPTTNNRALGAVARTDATIAQIRLQEAEQQRTIRSNVAVALDAVRQSARRVEAAREASALYRSAVDDQRETLQIGLSTVIDLVLTE